jgi:hypothetical protein
MSKSKMARIHTELDYAIKQMQQQYEVESYVEASKLIAEQQRLTESLQKNIEVFDLFKRRGRR